ncbi:HORMA domain-containing protein 2-like isoform X2 [Macrobrachium nipponense]|uniref:HORMA domain-containing protein 2-like isoform X2 n=1 Tax=Macrobrachium nipponense TaxID=159736 RepID=UPI0030C7E555
MCAAPTKMMAKPTQAVEQQTSTNAYGDHCLDGLSLKVLTDESPCKPSKVLFSWIQSCYDAIDRQYLRQLTLVIYEDPSQPDVVLETYTYKFKYTGGGAPGVEFSSSSAQPQEMKFDVRKPTRKMLRTIFLLTQSLRPLPRKVHLGMRLSYYDDVTPPDYEPKGFATAASSDFQHEDESINIAAGEVNTRYHNVKVRVSVDKKHFYGDEKSAEETAAQEVEEQESLNPHSDNIVRRYGYRLVSQSSDTSAPFSQVKCITGMKQQTAEGSDALRCPTTAKGSSVNSDIPSNMNGNLETQASENIDGNNILPQTPPSSASYRVPEMSTTKEHWIIQLHIHQLLIPMFRHPLDKPIILQHLLLVFEVLWCLHHAY